MRIIEDEEGKTKRKLIYEKTANFHNDILT